MRHANFGAFGAGLTFPEQENTRFSYTLARLALIHATILESTFPVEVRDYRVIGASQFIILHASTILGEVLQARQRDTEFEEIEQAKGCLIRLVHRKQERLYNPARIPCFAPNTRAAKIEGSKVFAKNFMQEFNIPTAQYATFSNYEKAISCVSLLSHKIVIKADGLAAGKGVILPATKDEALSVLRVILVEGRFGSSGGSVVIEEFLDGQEISVSTFSDGHHTITLSIGQDHKRILDDDKGSNTGDMGVYAPVPCVTPEVMEQIERTILQPTFEAFRKRENPFTGLLFTGIMFAKTGPKVLEYNARFGNPETQTVLPLIDPGSNG